MSTNFLVNKNPIKILLTSGASCPDTMVENVIARLISFYSTLSGGAAPSTAIVKQQDVAMVIGIAVKHLDTALKDHVNFGQRS